MSVDGGFFYDDASVLVSEMCGRNTLLDLVNAYRLSPFNLPPLLALYITIELLRIVEHLHRVDVIHGDIKPDNVILRDRCVREVLLL